MRSPSGASSANGETAPASRAPSPRPRAVLVGSLPGIPEREALERTLELTTLSPEEAPAAATGSADVVLLDGSLSTSRLEACVQLVGRMGGAERPAVLVVATPERREELESLLEGHADDIVNGALGEEELLARIRGALRARGYLIELARKNAELAGLYDRLECMARRMAEELRLASNVQRSLMPPPLHHPRLDLAREFLPFREIGGDYYDLVPLGRDSLAFAIGDVMGKGVPAALLAANLKACLRAQLQSGDPAPAELAARVNRLFYEVTPRGLFATLFFGVFDLERGRFQYVNAGHDHPFRVRPDGSLQELVEGGTVLGLLEGSRYEQGEVDVRSGDLLVFYSDGVTDRVNSQGELYGLERLKEAAARNRFDAPRIVLYTLLGDVQGWSSGCPAEDDMTLVVAKVR